MSAFALTLVLAAAVIHATWNYLLKRSGGGTLFVWAFATLSALIYAPLALAIVWWQQPALSPEYRRDCPLRVSAPQAPLR